MRLSTLPLLIIAMFAASQGAMAFNCSGTTLASSVVICSDADLMRLADERQEIYNETRSRLSPDQQNALWEDQKAWVRRYASTCGVPPDSPPPKPIPPTVVECFKRAAGARAAYLRAYGVSRNPESIPGPQPVAAQSNGADGDEVALVQAGRLFEIPVRINGAITLNFIIDSGASDVQIPLDVFSTLVRANTIADSDIIGEQTYTLADGSEKKTPKFQIRELKIGHYILHNVPGSVGSPKGALLLGESFLSHFDSWTLDNKRHVLKLVGKSSEVASEAASSASSSGQTASLSFPVAPRGQPSASRTAVVCGKPIEYAMDETGGGTSLVGVWTGNWNNAGRLCGALIVQGIDPRGTADVIYVYGPSRSGSSFPWKQQHRIGSLSDGVLSFQDDQGSTFKFRASGPGELDGVFVSRTGRLTATFQHSR